MTKFYVNFSTGTYTTEKPVVVEVADESLEQFCELTDRGRARLIRSGLDHGPRRNTDLTLWKVIINSKGRIV